MQGKPSPSDAVKNLVANFCRSNRRLRRAANSILEEDRNSGFCRVASVYIGDWKDNPRDWEVLLGPRSGATGAFHAARKTCAVTLPKKRFWTMYSSLFRLCDKGRPRCLTQGNILDYLQPGSKTEFRGSKNLTRKTFNFCPLAPWVLTVPISTPSSIHLSQSAAPPGSPLL